MSHFLLLPLFAACANVALAIFVITRDPRLRVNQVFCAWGLALGIWNLGAFFLFRVTNPADALFWARFTNFGVVFLPAIFLHLCLLLTKKRSSWIVPTTYAVSLVFALGDFTPFFIKGVRHVSYGWFSVAGMGFWIFAQGFFPLLVLPALWLLVRKVRSCPPNEWRKFMTLALANCMLAILGTNDLFPIMGFDFYPLTHVRIYPWGSLAASLYGILVGYGVLHDQLLDMRVSLGRHAATFLRLAFLLATAYILLTVCALISPDSYTIESFVSAIAILAVSAGVTAYFFPRLLGGRTERLERRILGDLFEYQEQVRAFVNTITGYTDATKLIDDTAILLNEAMSFSLVEIVVLDVRTQEIQHLSRQPRSPESWADGLGPDSPVFEFLRVAREPFLDCRNPGSDPWSRDVEKDARRRLQERHQELGFRIGSREKPFGILIVGGKTGDSPITGLDMELLLSLSSQLGFAIDRIRLAEQAALNDKHEVMSDMSRGLAHDLNGLITPVSTYLQLQTGIHEVGTDSWDLHRMAVRKISTIKSYVQEAVFFATTLKLNTVPVSVAGVLSGLKEVAELRAKEAGVELKFTAPSAEVRFFGDRILLQRMLSNLVFNAIDASDSGKVVEVTGQLMASQRRRSDWIRFLVADHGGGIPPENLSRVFDPYFSTKDTGDNARGFGLGLTVTQRIVNLHNGQISIKSALGYGTTVQVDLPSDPQDEAPINPAHR
jgi:signal transduction histidine kinase